ncbi:MAG: hypothetical protein K0R29_2546, partial [Pseudobdellovibrio sp.]|nr:hypothetical protein [Pseudobdellovibrio sp.]
MKTDSSELKKTHGGLYEVCQIAGAFQNRRKNQMEVDG